MTNSPVSRPGLYRKRGEDTSPQIPRKEAGAGQNGDRSDRPAYRTYAADRMGSARLLAYRELNLTLITARKFDQRIVIGSDTIMRKWAARPFLHIRRQFGRELAMSRFLQQRAGEVIEQLVDSLAARS
jgi:hypothetical protein